MSTKTSPSENTPAHAGKPPAQVNQEWTEVNDTAWQLVAARMVLGVCGGVSALVVFSWLIGWDSFPFVNDGLPTLKVNTAIGLILLSIAGWIRSSGRFGWAWTTALSLSAAAIGLATAAEVVWHVDYGIDNLIAIDGGSVASGSMPGRMSLSSACALACMGIGLSVMHGKGKWIGIVLTGIGGLIGALATVHFFSPDMFEFENTFYSGIGFQTAMVIAFLALGLVMATRVERRLKQHCDQDAIRGHLRQIRPMIVSVTAVLLLGLATTTLLVNEKRRVDNRTLRGSFLEVYKQIEQEVHHRLEQHVMGLSSIRGLYAASKSVERIEFDAFLKSRELSKEFPGALGIGFVKRANRDQLEAFVTAERADDAPSFEIRGDDQTSQDLLVITHIYPRTEALTQWGTEIGTNSELRRTIEMAIQTGTATISQRTHLVHDHEYREGVVYFMPVYKNGTKPQTPEERGKALLGLVYVPVVVDAALSHIMEPAAGKLEVEMFDGESTTESRLLFDSDSENGAGDDEAQVAALSHAHFSTTGKITVANRDFTTVVHSTTSFEATKDHMALAAMAVSGVLVSVLMAGVVWTFGMSRGRAMALAAQMTQELRTSEAIAREQAIVANRLAEIARRTSNGVLILDTRGKIEWLNDGFTRNTGYILDEVAGKSPSEFLHGALTNQTTVATLQAAMARGDTTRVELFNYDKNGKAHLLQIEMSPLRNGTGVLTGFMTIEADVTEQRAAEIKMKESEARFRTLADSAPMMVWTGGTDAKYDYFNRRWLDFRGRTLQQELGDGWAQGLHQDDIYQCLATYMNAFASRKPFEMEYRLKRHDGEFRTIMDRGVPRISENGEFQGFVGACTDVTELRDAQFKAEAASKSKSAFLANMSHEIRTPLTAILGFTEVLRDEGDIKLAPEHRIQTIETIRSAGTHLLTVINDILDLSKIEADKMSVEKIETELVNVLHEVESLMRQRAHGKGVAVKTEFASPLPTKIMSDPTRLRQILMNLMGNAVKFTESGTITLRAGVDMRFGQSWLVIDVNDTGLGMTAEQGAKLFKAFGQADDTMTRKFGGTGLGLTICQRLAGLLGGTVSLERSAPGEGSCFRVELPLTMVEGCAMIERMDAIRITDKCRIAGDAVKLNGHILLAEDGLDNQRLIAFHLRKAGATVDIADNGKIALEKIEKSITAGTPYSMLLTDMQMPEMDGYTLARTLRQSGSTLAIVALTAHAMAEDRAKCTNVGCDDYATKPLDKQKLLETCAMWMGKESGNTIRKAA